MNAKIFILRALTYCGYIISVLNVTLRWFIMGSPLGRGLEVGYWGGTTYSEELGKRYLEVEKFEQLGIARSFAIPLNYVLTYFHLAIIAALFITLIVRIYFRIKQGKNYKSNGYLVTGIMSAIVLIYLFILKIL
ncbi:hypothetical protein [Sphingobacterium lactis]|uniref:Uncharacterized protein n=1 Tax=Sphingobacterium lactis TaxID=797291 RepID=A0A1H5X382_9SPHI|nr:hypothetical protein [Sphingobacterium lactis]SEG06309.1 hypothetical protein SAMN05421877_104255 [Sphingobacterium lactis]